MTLSYVSPNKRAQKPKLKVLTVEETKLWGERVIEQLRKVANLEDDKFIILAGQSYIKPLNSSLTNIEEPLKGVVQGKRPAKLKDLINEENGK